MGMITIDGSEGEGGGQILRTSLALSLVTGQPFRMERIRAKRQKPGLLRQHLTAVEAAEAVGCAEVMGGAMNSQTLEFRPQVVTPGNYRFAVGTAGSATLVLQTVLPSLLTASSRSTLTLEGGGSFRTTKPSLHSTTNAAVIQRFLPVPIRFEQESDLVWRVTVGTR